MYHFNFIDRFVSSLKKPYEQNYNDFSMYPGGRKIYDNEICEFVIKRLKPTDWLNPYKVTCAIQWAFICLYDEMKKGEDPEEIWKQMF